MHFPNKVIKEAYCKAIGHTFTHSPSQKKFFDEHENSEYNYYPMLWLLDNNVLQELPWCGKSFVKKYRINK